MSTLQSQSIRTLCRAIPRARHVIQTRPLCIASASRLRNSNNQTSIPLNITKPKIKCGTFTQARQATAASSPSEGHKTPLYDLHVKNGGKMVMFAKYLMPQEYEDQSIGDSHRWVREKCGLFDVSHMVQHQFTGPKVTEFLESLCPADLEGLGPYHSCLSVLLHPDGGIIDDMMVTKHSHENFYLVTNADNSAKDTKHFTEQLEQWNNKHKDTEPVKHHIMREHGLIALQGPESQNALQKLVSNDIDLNALHFGQAALTTLNTNPRVTVHIARGGYTGEDGFEISIPADKAENVVESILKSAPETVKLIGLGARDSLRLEAGMCLYGNDLDDTTTPVEAALGWLIPTRRREGGGFPGHERIMQQLASGTTGGGVKRKRVGFWLENAIPRHGHEIVETKTGQVVGVVTSGCPSPSTGKGIGMGYIELGKGVGMKSGSEVGVLMRGKLKKGVIKKMPFIETKYWKGLAPA